MNTIENINYANDHRNCEPDKPLIVCMPFDDGGWEEVTLPTVWGVCDVCHGKGKHVNPAIDCNGLTAEDFDDPYFAESYLGDVYDIPCNKCSGRTTISIVDWDALTPEIRTAYEQQLQEDACAHAEHLAEIRMGA